jgi:hypothetical protein
MNLVIRVEKGMLRRAAIRVRWREAIWGYRSHHSRTRASATASSEIHMRFIMIAQHEHNIDDLPGRHGLLRPPVE